MSNKSLTALIKSNMTKPAISVNAALGEEQEGQIANSCHYQKSCDIEECFCDVLTEEMVATDFINDAEWDIPTAEHEPPDAWWQEMLNLGGQG